MLSGATPELGLSFCLPLLFSLLSLLTSPPSSPPSPGPHTLVEQFDH